MNGNKVAEVLPDLTDENKETDAAAKKSFEGFVKTVKEKNIMLYLIQSPLYINPFNSSVSLDTIKNILKKYDVPFLDYGFDTALIKKEYFYDNLHLNHTGATLFTRILVSDIKADLGKNKPGLLNHH